MAVATPEEVRRFWFGDGGWSNARLWFEAGTSLDEEVRERFGDTIEAALRGDLAHWAEDVHDRVALIVVLDQFTRHAFRGTPRFVAGDAAAQRHVLSLLDAGDDRHLASEECLFLLTVLEHAEDRDLATRARQEATRLGAIHADLSDMGRYVAEHADIIDRFGRFPDRNSILGRPATTEEAAFLKTTHLAWFEAQE